VSSTIFFLFLILLLFIFLALHRVANNSERKEWFIGGNAALMANRFAIEGCSVLLGGAVGNTLSSLLHPSIDLLDSASLANFKEEVHLILEYKKESTWGTFHSPRANRFIISSDETNSKIEPLELFHASLSQFQPTLLVLSGLHLLEGQPFEFREARLKAIQSFLENPTSDFRVHLELASIGDLRCLEQILQHLVPRVDSLGLNEQELGSVYKVLTGESSDDFKSPSLDLMTKAVKKIFSFVNKNPAPSQTLSRIHFHCLTYHVVVERTASKWGNGGRSVASGSLAASLQACGGVINPSTVDLLYDMKTNDHTPIPPSHPTIHWEEAGLQFHLAPVLVCKKPQKTVGLGDAISAIGLLTYLE
jgi:ADP-dependent glucokinase